MNHINNFICRLDNFQRRRRLLGFLYAVIKKYGEDEAGYKAALLTYYGFLSLFPLLLVLTTVTSAIAGTHPALQHAIIRATTNYFPVLGNQLSEHVQSLHRSGLALAFGLLFTFYGARGVADAFRHGINHIWRVPKADQDKFPSSLIKSLKIIVIGGGGLIVASISASLAAGVGRGLTFRILSLAINLFILFWLFTYLLNLSLPQHLPLKKTRSGAASAAIGLVALQGLGGYLLSRELRSLDALYSYFAIALGLLFWIYLQSQMLFYAIELSSVRANRLYPRSLSGKDLMDSDKRASASNLSK